MKVPSLDLRIQFPSIRDEVLAEITPLCDAQQFILGPDVERFEREVADRIDVRHAIGASSGTDAILVAR